MSDQPQPLTGPDLTQGVDANEIPDGAMLLGHAQGEPVLVARVGDEYFATGATCTHYSGPLNEGLVVGETVRCPWHHACFSLRTGVALGAPALNPIPCWTVERTGGRIRVTEKHERGPLQPVGRPEKGAHPRRVVIIGAGAAGAAAAEMLRRQGHEGSITIVDREQDSPYDRPNLSKDFLAGNAPPEWIPLRPEGFYAEHGVEIVRGEVTRIDTGSRRIEVADHAPVEYDALLLATGAEPVRLKMPGADLPHVFVLRSLADSKAIIERAKQSKRAVVIGASFIGLETAASLRARGLEVHVVAPEGIPLERVMGKELGAWVQRVHEAKGVVFHLGTTAARIERDAAVLEDGTRLAADLVVMGVGVKPRVSLAESAGLAMGNGVLVNEYLETSVPGVYAAGDIANWPDARTGERIRVEHWVVAERQGQTAARNILGQRVRFDAVPFFWSQHYDASINYVGHVGKWARTEIEGDFEARDVAVRYLGDGGKLLALATVFRDDESLRTEARMEREGAGRA